VKSPPPLPHHVLLKRTQVDPENFPRAAASPVQRVRLIRVRRLDVREIQIVIRVENPRPEEEVLKLHIRRRRGRAENVRVLDDPRRPLQHCVAPADVRGDVTELVQTLGEHRAPLVEDVEHVRRESLTAPRKRETRDVKRGDPATEADRRGELDKKCDAAASPSRAFDARRDPHSPCT
jgi:hypothetical protein